MYYLIVAVSIVAQAQVPDRSPQNQLSVGDVINRWEAGADLIASYDVSLMFTGKTLLVEENGKKRLLAERDASPSPPIYSRIYRKAGKRRGDFMRDEHGHYHPPMLWDGKTGYLFQDDGDTVVMAPWMVAFGSNANEDYEATYRSFMGTYDRIALSKARKSKLLPREGKLFVVDVPTGPGDFYNAHWRVWLDPNRNFMPVELTQWFAQKGREHLSSERKNELREVSAGVWVPVRSLLRIFYSDESSQFFGKCTYICELKVIEDQSKFNVDIPDALFEVKIPNGMTVIDRGRNVVYTFGSKNADRYLAKLAREEKTRLDGLSPTNRLPRETVFIPADDSSSNHSLAWPALLLINITGAVVFVVIYFVRRWRLRKEA